MLCIYIDKECLILFTNKSKQKVEKTEKLIWYSIISIMINKKYMLKKR